MAKIMEFEFKGKEYHLEFTLKTVAELEKKGFVASDILDKPVTTLPALFAGAFLANHRFTKQEVIEEIFSKLRNKEELIGKLAEMYNEPVMSLVAEPEESTDNIEFATNW